MASLSRFIVVMCLAISILASSMMVSSAAKFNQEFDITWGNDRAKILNDGALLTLSLDKVSGSGFQSKNQYLFGKIDMQLKLVPGNSAGTVTAYYLSSQGSAHDEIDFEFLGNLSGDPYTLHTNLYSQGKGEREQQFRLWFDPAADFHTYSILWNPKIIVFFVDGTPVREFKNMESIGVPYPKNQPMRLYSSIWNADDWATRGGLIKTDWTQAPFTTSYANFKADACVWSSGATSCGWLSRKSDAINLERLKWVQRNFMIYNYCTDTKRFPHGFPPECKVTAICNFLIMTMVFIPYPQIEFRIYIYIYLFRRKYSQLSNSKRRDRYLSFLLNILWDRAVNSTCNFQVPTVKTSE